MHLKTLLPVAVIALASTALGNIAPNPGDREIRFSTTRFHSMEELLAATRAAATASAPGSAPATAPTSARATPTPPASTLPTLPGSPLAPQSTTIIIGAATGIALCLTGLLMARRKH